MAKQKPMSAPALRALRGSIRKWRAIVAGTGLDKGTANCPLCKLYNNSRTFTNKDCRGCPIAKATGQQYCYDTPYDAWTEHHLVLEEDGPSATIPGRVVPGCKECVRLANDMLDFLVSLLPAARAKKGKRV